MAEEKQSRIAAARARAEAAKRTVAIAAAVVFVATVALARASNPGQAAQPASSDDAPLFQEDDQSDDSFGFGSGSVAPSTGSAPSFGTHAS